MKPDNEDPAPRPQYVEAESAREIAKEHAAIYEVIRGIEQELDRLLDNPAARGARWELPALAKSCREHLRRHFQLEEGAGILGSSALAHDPEARRAVRELIEEHRDFGVRIERIIEELNTGFVPADTVQHCFDGELRTLISDMARPESREFELIRMFVRRPAGDED